LTSLTAPGEGEQEGEQALARGVSPWRAQALSNRRTFLKRLRVARAPEFWPRLRSRPRPRRVAHATAACTVHCCPSDASVPADDGAGVVFASDGSFPLWL